MSIVAPPSTALSNIVPFVRPIAPVPPPIGLGIAAGIAAASIVTTIAAAADMFGAQDSARKAQINTEKALANLSRINYGKIDDRLPPPFTGGQSVGVVYNVAIVYNRFFAASGWQIQSSVFEYEGPISWSRNDGAVLIYSAGVLVNAFGVERRGFEFVRVDISRADGLPDLGGNPLGEKIGENFTPNPNGIGSNQTGGNRRLAPPPSLLGGNSASFGGVLGGFPASAVGSAGSVGSALGGAPSPSGFSGAPTQSPTGRPATSPPPTTPPPTRTPEPPPKKKEEEKKVMPPPNQVPPVNPDTALILGAIASASTTTNNLINQVNRQTSAANLRDAAQKGSCDTLNSPQCTKGMEDRIKDPVLQNVGAVASIVDATSNKLDGVKIFLEKVASSAKLDKVYNLLTFITVIHNAQMLSSSLATTLMDSLSLGLATFGVKDENESPIDIQKIINKSVEDAVKSVIGTANYNTISERWKGAVRVYQAGANILYQVRSLWDSAKSLNELTGANVGRIGNALRRDGVVSENAYPAMPDSPLMVNSAMTRLQNLEEAASHLSSITSEAYGITETVAQIKKDQEDFKKLVKESPITNGTANDAQKAKDDAAKIASISPSISTTDLVKPD